MGGRKMVGARSRSVRRFHVRFKKFRVSGWLKPVIAVSRAHEFSGCRRSHPGACNRPLNTELGHMFAR
jgi:hypothetical protein